MPAGESYKDRSTMSHGLDSKADEYAHIPCADITQDSHVRRARRGRTQLE